MSYYIKPPLPDEKFEAIYVVGDSVSAGIGGRNEKTWPEIISDEFDVNIINLAVPGATVASAISQAKKVEGDNVIVLLEIGGNDLFNNTPESQFRQSLKQIIKESQRPTRLLVMFELPLLPRQTKYGRIQRQLAKQYDVVLIPKRFFVKVISAKNASYDLAHLTPTGHKLMAQELWNILGPNMKKTNKR